MSFQFDCGTDADDYDDDDDYDNVDDVNTMRINEQAKHKVSIPIDIYVYNTHGISIVSFGVFSICLGIGCNKAHSCVFPSCHTHT